MFGSGTACVVCPVNRIHYGDTDVDIPTMEQKDAVFQKLYNDLNDIYVSLEWMDRIGWSFRVMLFYP